MGALLAGATALNAGTLQQFAVLLLRHTLAALLDNRTHCVPFIAGECFFPDVCGVQPCWSRPQILTRTAVFGQLVR